MLFLAGNAPENVWWPEKGKERRERKVKKRETERVGKRLK